MVCIPLTHLWQVYFWDHGNYTSTLFTKTKMCVCVYTYLSHRSWLLDNWLRWSLHFLWLCSFCHRLQSHSMVSTEGVYFESLRFYKTQLFVTHNFMLLYRTNTCDYVILCPSYFFKNKWIYQYWCIWTEFYYNTTFKTVDTLWCR